MRSFCVVDNFLPRNESFESGTQQLMGGSCEYNRVRHDAMVKYTRVIHNSAIDVS